MAFDKGYQRMAFCPSSGWVKGWLLPCPAPFVSQFHEQHNNALRNLNCLKANVSFSDYALSLAKSELWRSQNWHIL